MLFVFVSALAVLIILALYGKRLGSSNMFVYISKSYWPQNLFHRRRFSSKRSSGVCNILGCIGVLLSKGIGIVIGSVVTGNINYLFDFMSWFVVLGVVGGAVAQLYYLNLSLKYFDASIIAPLKYVGTNILVVVGSSILYKEFSEMSFG